MPFKAKESGNYASPCIIIIIIITTKSLHINQKSKIIPGNVKLRSSTNLFDV